MNITIIIPVATDNRIKKCITSIDEDCEILVVANGATREIMSLLNSLKEELGDKINVLEISERNLGLARDLGIKNAKNDKVILMDSDCIFEKGTINLLYRGLEDHKVAKGRVIFLSDDFFSNIIKKVREYTTSDRITAYAPLLALKKEIINDIDGYYFDHDIHWVDDAELDLRIRKYGIKINYIPKAIIYHHSLKLFDDLCSAFRYGYGKRIGVRKGIMEGVGAFWGDIPNVVKEKGFFASIYLILWNIAYCCGFFFQPYVDPYGVNKKLKSGGDKRQ